MCNNSSCCDCCDCCDCLIEAEFNAWRMVQAQAEDRLQELNRTSFEEKREAQREKLAEEAEWRKARREK